MKKLLYAASLLTILFTGCFDDDDPVSSSSISATSKVVAQAPTTFPEDMKNVRITFNPTVVILSDATATYENDDNTSVYPYEPDVIDINISITDAGNMLGFTTTIDGKELELGFQFIDIGGKGFIDYAELSVVKLDGNMLTADSDEIDFGFGNVRNNYIDATDIPDFNTTAPNATEWNRYAVGTSVLITDQTESGSVSLMHFNSSTSGIYYDQEIAAEADMNVSDGFDFTYTYEQGENNNGIIKMSYNILETDGTNNGYTYNSEVTLTFSDLVSGTWSEDSELIDSNGSDVTQELLGDNWNGTGTFQLLYSLDDAKKQIGIE